MLAASPTSPGTRAIDLDDVRDQCRPAGRCGVVGGARRALGVSWRATSRRRRPRASAARCGHASPCENRLAHLARGHPGPRARHPRDHGVTGLTGSVTTGALLALDGDAATVVVGPDDEQRAAMRRASPPTRAAPRGSPAWRASAARPPTAATRAGGERERALALGEVAEYVPGLGLVRTDIPLPRRVRAAYLGRADRVLTAGAGGGSGSAGGPSAPSTSARQARALHPAHR